MAKKTYYIFILYPNIQIQTKKEEFSGIVPNPHFDRVYEGIDLDKRNGTDFLLAVGGDIPGREKP